MTENGVPSRAVWWRATLLAAALAVLVPGAAGSAPAGSGKYEGLAYEAGEKPSPKEWVRFKVSSGGRSLKAFSVRLWVVCYVGPPSYYANLPTVIRVPREKISRSGKVDREWRQSYEVEDSDEQYELEGHLALKFRGKKATGKIRVAFADCGTTTGDPPGYMRIRAERSR
jgi:hypothetical protein